MTDQRRTKRRYAHELYPHGEEFETRSLEVEVPYLYARAIGMDVTGTGWFAHVNHESGDRTMHMINARQTALMADAMLQGLTGNDAWFWADQRMDESGEWVYERAEHYGVKPALIKPYACGPKPDHHDHYGPEQVDGWCTVTRVTGTEDDCADCTEPIEASGDNQ
jgi:hypothetical protein